MISKSIFKLLIQSFLNSAKDESANLNIFFEYFGKTENWILSSEFDEFEYFL